MLAQIISPVCAPPVVVGNVLCREMRHQTYFSTASAPSRGCRGREYNRHTSYVFAMPLAYRKELLRFVAKIFYVRFPIGDDEHEQQYSNTYLCA
jgi:hypothetical protein